MASQKPIENELRALRFYPFPVYERDFGSDLDTGDENLKVSVGHAGSFSFGIDLSLVYQVPEGTPLKLVSTGFNGTNFTIRVELESPDPEFKKRFSVGDRVAIDHKNNWFNYDGEVTFVDDQSLEYIINSFAGGGALTEANFEGGVKFRNYQRLKSFDIKFNFCPLSLTDFSNGFDGGSQTFSALSSNLSVGIFAQTGSVKNWQISDYISELRQFTAKLDYNVDYNDRTIIFPYEFRGLPFVVPFWNEGLAENYNSGTTPDDLEGDNTLKLIVSLSCWRDEDRTHDPIVFEFEKEGSFGWYDENGNGGESAVKFDSVDYFNLSKSAITEGLDASDLTEVKLNLSRNFGNFESSNKISVYLFRKTPFDEYDQSKEKLELTYLYSGTVEDIGGTSSDKVGKREISTFNSTISNGGQNLEVLFNHDPKPSSTLKIQEGDQYVLAVTVYDENDENLSQLLVDQKEYSIFTDEDNLFEIVKGRVLDPDATVKADALGFPEITADQGHSSGEFWIEDGLIFNYQLRQFDRNGSQPFGEIVSLKMKLIANKDSVKDGRLDYSDSRSYFVIQEFDIPFDIVDNSLDVPIYRGQSERNFNLSPDDFFDKISVNTTGNGSGSALIDVFASLKINWQFWNKLDSVPDLFFNQTDAFNGKNERSSNYSEKPQNADEFNIRGVLFVECQNQNNSKTTTTAVEIPLRVYDYGEDKNTRDNDFPDFVCEITTERLDGTDLSKTILTNEPTKIKAHFINQGRVSGSQPFWFMIRIEENEQPSNDIFEISTLRTPLTGSPLEPLDGELTVKVTPDGSDGYFVECQTNPDELDSSVTYKPSARFGSNEDGSGIGFGYSEGFTTGFDS